jgi:hypothetical protein
MKINDIPIVLHTIDSYSKFWDTWYFLFKKYCINHGPIYFLSEEKEPSFVKEINHIKTGYGEWGERLIRGLSQINSELIIYMQEDFWGKDKLILNDTHLDLFYEFKMDQLHIKGIPPPNMISVSKVKDNLFRLTQNSQYTHNHQFGILKKDKFLSNILPNENPWDNEINGTKRLNKTNHNVYLLDYDWYVTSVRRGKIMERGIKVLKDNNLEYGTFLH